jgi:uncharacterized lipoprotein YehR (DUF1307 family)
MKRMKRVLALVLALCFAMSLVGCGGGSLKTGKYVLDEYKINGQDLMAVLAITGMTGEQIGYLEVIDDKNAKMVVNGDETKLTYDGSYFYMDGQKQSYKVSGSKISMSISEGGQTMEMVFKK